MTEHIGFVGLGAMGLGIAANLAAAGHTVHGYDPAPERQKLAADKGIQVVDSPRAAAEAADEVVISVVRTKAQTEEILFGEQGVTAIGTPRTVVISSTLDPSVMRAISDRLAAGGSTAVDATMSGGPWGAEAGTLTLMVSGPVASVDRVRPLLDAVSERLYVVGETVGTGQATKLAVQLSFGIQMMAAFEALQIVRSHGVDETQLMEILTHSVGGSWTTRNWERVKPWWENYVPGEDLDILLKDLRSVVAEADHDMVPVPMSALTFQLLREVWRGRK
jgi:3-hydroxyisobutyrate dehydrogenase-like beta-hydroxyacid dehydrogenase